jgi:fluoride exporter
MNGAADPVFLAMVAAGGGVGAWLRCALLRLALAGGGGGRPLFDPRIATLAANLLACVLLGGLLSVDVAATRPDGVGALAVRAFGITGVCGSLSTFSTLCAEIVGPLRRKRFQRTALFVLAHLVGGPLALGLGFLLRPLVGDLLGG